MLWHPQGSLTEYEQWLDQYFSTVIESAISSGDDDNDSLVLSESGRIAEAVNADTDFDGLTDDDEININSYPTNPRNDDTDGDGFLDSTELIPELLSIGFHPLILTNHRLTQRFTHVI